MSLEGVSRRGFLRWGALSSLGLLGSCRWERSGSQQPLDLVLSGGILFDGSGARGFRGDLGIRGGRIQALGDLRDVPRSRTISVDGLAVAPGFIDIHNHSDYTLLQEPLCESMVRQGVTTLVLGEGGSAGPVRAGEQEWTTLGGYFSHVEARGVAVNVCSYVGQGQVWTYVKGYEHRAASPEELEEMKRLVAQAMEEGARGLSTSLLMPPANLITTSQLVELASVAAGYGGIYSTHIRDEGEGVFESVKEAIEIGKRARIPVDIIHLKIAHRALWGRMEEVLALIREARQQGLDIQANVYPYTAGQNNLAAIVPPWAHEGGRERMLQRLAQPELRARMKQEILEGIPGWYNHFLATGEGWDGMILVSLSREGNRPFQGKQFGELVRARRADPVEVLFDLLQEEEGSVPAVFFHHSEEDMQLALRQPFTSVGSDGAAVSPDGPTGKSHPHPRYYGTFPRVLGRYVRELRLLSLPEAIRKMSSLNAEKIGLRDRGRLQEGFWADIIVFDPDRVTDRATFTEPHQYPEGIHLVLVNGQVVFREGERDSVLPGQVLRGARTPTAGSQG